MLTAGVVVLMQPRTSTARVATVTLHAAGAPLMDAACSAMSDRRRRHRPHAAVTRGTGGATRALRRQRAAAAHCQTRR